MKHPARIIRRSRLLLRLSSAQARVVTLIAPAGYGKSTLAREYAGTFSVAAFCDSSRASDADGFARELAFALKQGDPSGKDALANQQIAASAAAQPWTDFVERFWSDTGGVPFIVFENMEHVCEKRDVMELFARLLARNAPDRFIAVCSRRALPLSLTRLFPPNDVLSLSADDLRFDVDETAQAFARIAAASEQLERITQVTRGWPMAVLLFARLARERSVQAILDRVSPMPLDELYDYLTEHVWAGLGAERKDMLLAVTAIPNALAHEVAIAVGAGESAIADLPVFANTIPLLYAGAAGQYEAHPLVAQMLRERFPDGCRAMLFAAANGMREVNPLRAAELYLHAGDEDAAAALLQDVSELWLSETPNKFIASVSQMAPRTLMRYPALWAAATAVRITAIPQRQWLEEALIVHETLDERAPAKVHLGVATSLGNALSNFGRHDETLRILDRFVESHPDLTPEFWALVAFYQAGMNMRSGRFDGALDIWNQAKPVLADVKWTHAIGIVEVEAKLARYRGDRIAERTLLDAAVSLARTSGTQVAVTMTLQEAAFAAWFAGEDALFNRYARELEEAIVPTTARGTEVFRTCARGDYDLLLRRIDFEHPKIRCYAALIACAGAPPEQRAEIAGVALAAADEAGEPALAALASIAQAECNDDENAAAVRRAQSAAGAVQSTFLVDAVRRYVAGDEDCAYLSAYVSRFRSARSARSRAVHVPTLVCLHKARVLKGTAAIPLSRRERELLLFLAARRQPRTWEEIVEALWPERRSADSTVLRVYVGRVRVKLKDVRAIENRDGLYTLGRHIEVDVDQLDRAVRDARKMWPMTDRARKLVRACLQHFEGAQSPAVNLWSWWGGVSVRMESLVREATMLLVRDSLDRNDAVAALDLGRRLIELDPCDEAAREYLIRAHLLQGDRYAAMREFRAYRDAMAGELGAEPSAALARLVSFAAGA